MLKSNNYSIWGSKRNVESMINSYTLQYLRDLNIQNVLKKLFKYSQIEGGELSGYSCIPDMEKCLLDKTWQFKMEGDTVGNGSIELFTTISNTIGFRSTIDYRAHDVQSPVTKITESGTATISDQSLTFFPENGSILIKYLKNTVFQELDKEPFAIQFQTGFSVIEKGINIDSLFYLSNAIYPKLICLTCKYKSEKTTRAHDQKIVQQAAKTDDKPITLDDATYNISYFIDDGKIKGTITFYNNPQADNEGIFKEEIMLNDKKLQINGKYEYSLESKTLSLETQKSKVNWIVKELSKDDQGYQMKVVDEKANTTTLSNGVNQLLK